MNKQEFCNKLNKFLPTEIKTEDFENDYGNILDEYRELVTSLDIEIINNNGNRQIIIKRLNIIIEALKAIIKCHYDSSCDSFKNFTKLVNNIDEELKLLNLFNTHIVKPNTYQFRARKHVDNIGDEPYKEMFHICFEKKDLAGLDRYSKQGYPCLYLGSTINVCWKEIYSPEIEKIMVSCLKTTQNIKLLDLRYPQEKDFNDINFEKVLLRIPLIISCSIISQNKKVTTKPEYIVPQLLSQYIIDINKEIAERTKNLFNVDNNIVGVIYTSTFKSNSRYTCKKDFENIAIPVYDNSKKEGFDSLLSKRFKITKPEIFGNVVKMEEIENKSQLIKIHELENSLKKKEFKQLDYIILSFNSVDVDPKTGLCNVPISLKANDNWSIE